MNKENLKRELEILEEYEKLINFIEEKRYGRTIFDLKIKHKGLFEDKFTLYTKKQEVDKEVMINILNKLIEEQENKIQEIIKKLGSDNNEC